MVKLKKNILFCDDVFNLLIMLINYKKEKHLFIYFLLLSILGALMYDFTNYPSSFLQKKKKKKRGGW